MTDEQAAELDRARGRMMQAEIDYRNAVVDALAAGGSFSEVAKVTGLSTNTLQRWKREANQWPWNMRRGAGK